MSTEPRFDQERFWREYDLKVRPLVDRACRAASRTRSDSTMDIHDMIAWVDTKVWRMLERGSSPTFHDAPTTDEAIERLTTHASTLARWAYLALCRQHYRRLNARTEYTRGMSRAERLAQVSAVDTKLEHRESLDEAMDALKTKLSDTERQKLAASWIEEGDRSRVALVLGATRREDDRMITKVSGGGMKPNTVEQMRSRAKKKAQDVIRSSTKLPLIVAAFIGAFSIMLTPSNAIAGEQSGGRRGSMTVKKAPAAVLLADDLVSEGEQTGGRG